MSDERAHVTPVQAMFRVFVGVEALAFFVGALLHLGVRLGGLHTDRVMPATVVESACAAGLAAGAYGLAAKTTWSWRGAAASHTLALAGVLLGVVAIAAGRGAHNLPNDVFHRVMLVVLPLVLVTLAVPRGRRTLVGAEPATKRREGDRRVAASH